MSTSNKPANLSPEEKEKIFRQKLEVLEAIESEINSMNQNYSEGQLQMGLACFQNDHLYHHLQPKAYASGPASLLVNFDASSKQFQLKEVPKEQLKFIYKESEEKAQKEEKNKIKMSYLVDDEAENEEFIKEEQAKLEADFKQKGINPLQQLGIHYPSHSLINAQASMRKSLESALKIANLLQNLK